MTGTRIDVIVPCYNYGRFLPDCVGSVLAQRGCDVRVLIIDDASTDDSLAVAQAIAAASPRVEVRGRQANQGHIATYNEGLAWVTADYMLLLSSDDMIAPGALARAIGVMETDRKVGFAYGAAIRFTDTSEIRAGSPAAAAPVVEAGPAFVRRFCARPVNTIESATAVVRSSLQKAVGGYRQELPHSGDMEMWLRLAAHGDVGVIPSVQAFTRLHARNMHLGYKDNHDLEDFRQRRLVFETFFGGHGRDLADRPALEALAWRSLAEELLWAAARAFDEGAQTSLFLELMEEATDICPAITRTALWWKVRARRLLGAGFWGAMGLRDEAQAG